jgi:hypothetical protein
MHMTGVDLRIVLLQQSEPVEVRTAGNRVVGRLAPEDALEMVRAGDFAGVGNARRIHHIKAVETAGSATEAPYRDVLGPVRVKWSPPPVKRDGLIKAKKLSGSAPQYVGMIQQIL